MPNPTRSVTKDFDMIILAHCRFKLQKEGKEDYRKTPQQVSSSELPSFTQMQTKIRQLITHLQQRQHHMISVASLHLICLQSAFSVQKVGLNLEGLTVPSGFILRPEFLLEFICCSFVCVKFTSA